jgi:hypothetical protein
VFSHWAYILIGENNTGKTSFQRNLVSHLCGKRYMRLPRNIVKEINHPRAPKALATIFTCNRSFQEKRSEYRSIEYYFKHFFQDADVCVLSSHTHGKSAEEIAEMIQMLKRRCYNVAGVFWSNSFDGKAREITLLPWSEILWIENPAVSGSTQIDEQLDKIARHFSELLIARANVQ